ncbi:enoyl-CoA hydratase/isomerase family protein [Cumulibacter manganitolerans]|uniref:enoyl-CoA hydratase/isomerase family protein n=1 Tax=Cumulibacter manganitolerans TaxID=1884992 RepID=UPI0012959F36|nr:enoyl-CoA hydratase-related protein [Cumulibacter manganitolerans]
MNSILYTETDHVGVITLNRPEVHNALSHEAYAELTDCVRSTTARALVITGAGKSFCSGDDVRSVMGAGERKPPTEGREPRLTPAADALLHTDVPVIAAVNGTAVGWGVELALMADIRIASRRARFGELFVKRGLCSDVAGLGLLAGVVGRSNAAELLFTGELIDADRAKQIGLVRDVVDEEQLMPSALELAGRIAANPPLAVAALKRGLRKALDPDWTELGLWVSRTLGELFATEDHREGVRSFLEKREPTYVGR